MFPEIFLLAGYTFHIKFYFSGKNKEKVPKIYIIHVIKSLFLLLEVIARDHLGMLVREHVSTQGTLAREHVSTQDTLAHERGSMG